jgi:hypothetical protein
MVRLQTTGAGATSASKSALDLSTTEKLLAHRILAEVARREMEALRLYQPMPTQAAFHASHADERVIRGGNRGGKTLAAFVEIARAITGTDPEDKYPKADGIAYLVGKDERHIARVMYKKLFKPGAFEIIKDLKTGKWRPVLPVLDDEREDEKRKAPPLVPHRFYSPKAISWRNKREGVPSVVRLKNGWEVHFFSSLGEPSQGVAVDLVAFDEEIEHPQWYPEMSARLIDCRKRNALTGKSKSGKFIWSATPQAGTQVLYELCERAAVCKGEPDPPVEDFHVTLLENTYISEESKQDFIRKLEGNEDEIGVRVYGDFALLGRKVYPEFTPLGVHGMVSFEIPPDWTRYIAVDPGRQVCAVLFAAIPPPSDPRHDKVFLYDELYIKRCSAQTFAERLKNRIHPTGQRIRAALVDHRAGRQTEIGSGRTIEQQYVEALQGVGISFEVGGSTFVWASDDVKAGIEAVRAGLHVVDGQSVKWIVFYDKCPWLCWEARKYAYKRNAKDDIPTDEPIKINDHAMDCWRYLAMSPLKWHKPRKAKGIDAGYTVEALRKKREKTFRKSGWGKSVRVG